MKEEQLWKTLINECTNNPLILNTRTGLFFNLESDGKKLIVKNSSVHPSCNLKSPRSIYKSDFLNVYPYYKRWVQKEKGLSKMLLEETRNHVYIMAAIKDKLKDL